MPKSRNKWSRIPELQFN